MRRLAAAGLALAALAGCGSSSSGSSRNSGGGEVKVSAATSLKKAFSSCAPNAALSFGGSDELAAQIRQGAKPDVFAAANTKLPKVLHAENRLSAPHLFASNELVIAVPKGSPIHSVADLAKPGTTIAVGQPSVPVGSYTRQVLNRLPPSEHTAILRNVRSEEPDVGGVVAKITQGAADAGVVYVTDVAASGGNLVAVHLPPRLQPSVDYGIGEVTGAPHPAAARTFVADVLDGRCHQALVAAKFGPPGG